MLRLIAIHTANFGNSPLPPLELLSTIRKLKLEVIFPNVCVALRMFCTLPVTVASAERSFSKLKLVKKLSEKHYGSREIEQSRSVEY